MTNFLSSNGDFKNERNYHRWADIGKGLLLMAAFLLAVLVILGIQSQPTAPCVDGCGIALE